MKVERRWTGVLMVAVFIPCVALGVAHAQVQGVYPDLSAWANDTWFKVQLDVTTYHFSGVGIKPKPSAPIPQRMGTAYINIRAWDGLNHVLTADIYVKDHDTDKWIATALTTIDIEYFAGSDLKFIGSAPLVTPNDVTMNLLFVFTGKKYQSGPKLGNFVLGGVTKLSTMGGSILEIDDAEDAPPDDLLKERWAGSATISGPMVSADNLPFTPIR